MLLIAGSRIGRLRDPLKQSGQSENSVWIITPVMGGLRCEGNSPRARYR
ncbi:MAG: hypothetical protein ACK5TN_22760 [Acidobacteriota bacterium]